MAVRRRDIEPEPEHHHEEARSTIVRRMGSPFGLGQALVMAAGMFFLITGGIGLIRGGVESLTAPAVEVVELGMTPLLALIHIAVGIIALAGAASRLDARWTGVFLGALLIVGGVIALAEPAEAMGWTDANGIAYLVTGGVLLAVAIMTPIFAREEAL